MDPPERFQLANLVIAAIAIAHGLETWPARALVALFAGGALLAFLAEVAVVRAGLLEHAMEPQVLGVPISVVIVWPAIVYVCLRLALLVVPAGLGAAALAAAVGTAIDLATDPVGVAEGVWTYPEHRRSTPRFAGVPWWNVAGWFAIVFATALIPLAVGV